MAMDCSVSRRGFVAGAAGALATAALAGTSAFAAQPVAVRDMAFADAREIAGTVLNEVEPVGDAGVTVAQGGMNA